MKNFEKLGKQLITKLSQNKKEPKAILDFRLAAFRNFQKLKNPAYGPNLNKIDFQDIIYYLDPKQSKSNDWSQVDKKIRDTFQDIGVIDAEEKYLSGLATQYESEVVYHSLAKELQEKGVIFTDMATAISEHYQLFHKYFAQLVKNDDNKYAALNSAVFSGGTFIYVPPGVVLSKPLHAYFRIDAAKMGQFERTLIIVDKGARLSYIEGCTAATYSSNALHAAVVEIFVQEDAICEYITLQNWSHNVYNLVTKRAMCEKNAQIKWIDGNIGSLVNMKYPAVILKGDNATAKMVSVSLAGKRQKQDTGGKMIHIGRNTSSSIVAKSIVQNTGLATYRGLIKHDKKAYNAKSTIECDTLLLDEKARSHTLPLNITKNGSSQISHEAKVSTLSEETLYYIMARGIDYQQASELIIGGFMESFLQELPMEYAAEFNALLKNEMAGAIG